jgi:hypothetical protein
MDSGGKVFDSQTIQNRRKDRFTLWRHYVLAENRGTKIDPLLGAFWLRMLYSCGERSALALYLTVETPAVPWNGTEHLHHTQKERRYHCWNANQELHVALRFSITCYAALFISAPTNLPGL